MQFPLHMTVVQWLEYNMGPAVELVSQLICCSINPIYEEAFRYWAWKSNDRGYQMIEQSRVIYLQYLIS